MPEPEAKIAFEGEMAAAYDQKWAKWQPMQDAMYLFIRSVFADLPERARLLCVGAGTGNELVMLARTFPGWSFTAVEPSTAMLDQCRRKLAAIGAEPRCQFHEGYLETLEAPGPFDAATSILVSHFLVDREERCQFFRSIADRLVAGGPLVTADLAWDPESPSLETMFRHWFAFNEAGPEEAAKFRSALGKQVAMLAPESVEQILVDGGFEVPGRIFQSLFIHVWYARRS